MNATLRVVKVARSTRLQAMASLASWAPPPPPKLNSVDEFKWILGLQGLIKKEWLIDVWPLKIGNFSNNHRDSKKAIRLISKTKTLHVNHAFLYISLPSLHNYNVKVPKFTFGRRQEHKTTTFYFFSWTLIQPIRIQLQKQYYYHWTKQTRWKKGDKVWSSPNSLFKVTFL